MKRFLPLTLVLLVSSAFGAAERDANGYYQTGEGVQTAAHWPFTMQLFSVTHESREIPVVKTRQAMIELDADKKLTLRMLRDVVVEHLKVGLEDRYRLNGYSNAETIHQFLAPLQGKVVATGSIITITYDTKSKTTTFAVAGGATASITGVEFMQATWSIWFGVSKPANLGDQLVEKLQTAP